MNGVFEYVGGDHETTRGVYDLYKDICFINDNLEHISFVGPFTLPREHTLEYNSSTESGSNLVDFRDSGYENSDMNSSILDSTFNYGQDTESMLQDWFKRPVMIQRYTWAEGASFAQTFNPWKDYFTTTSVTNKLKNYSRLRATMHVKAVINASPYQYSLLLMSYKPLATTSANDDFSGGNFDTTISTDSNIMMKTSRPHVFMYPQFSRGCEMQLPFLHFMNWIDITTSGTDLDNMGVISIDSLEVLRTSATASGNPITITVYAWCDEFETAGPTIQYESKIEPVDLATGESMQDEYEERPLSTSMSAVSRAAGSLASITPIRPYALATQMIAGGAASVARWFGFSNPPVIADVHMYRPSITPQFATPEISVPAEKLALDPKHEMTVDSRTIGSDGSDDMVISKILDRDVYLMKSDWNVSDAADTGLFATYVNPNYRYVVQRSDVRLETYNAINSTPADYISQMFKYWRGELTYKFKFIGSQFHRGRLLVTYDPAGPPGTGQTGKLVQKIWDISENPEFEFEVPYMAPTAWLECQHVYYENSTPFLQDWYGTRATSPALPYTANYYFNGALNVVVLNELMAPDPTAVASLMVFVNAKKIEYANPINNINTCNLIEYNSMVAEPSQDIVHTTLRAAKDQKESYLIYTGEVVRSTRQLMHRYVKEGTLSTYPAPSSGGTPPYDDFPGPSLTTANVVNFKGFHAAFIQPRTIGFPDYTKISTYGNNNPSERGCAGPVNIGAYMSPCYVGNRGSFVRSFIPEEKLSSGQLKLSNLSASRMQFDSSLVKNRGNANSRTSHPVCTAFFEHPSAGVNRDEAISNMSAEMNDYFAWCGFAGLSQTNQDINPVAEVEFPYYSRFRMRPGNPKLQYDSYDEGSTSDVMFRSEPDNYTLTLTACVNDGSTITNAEANMWKFPKVSVFAKCGSDYTQFFFLNPPTIYSRLQPYKNNSVFT